MPFLEHDLSKDLNESDTIWRYLNFYKFMSLIQFEQLYFTRLDKFESDFEGMYSNPRLKVNVVDIRINQDQNDLEIDNPLLIKRSFELLSEQLETSTREQAKVQRQCAFTNVGIVVNMNHQSNG